MGLLKRLFGKGRRGERLEVRLSVLMKTTGGEEKTLWTEDLSETGLRMNITEVRSLSDLTGGGRDIRLGLVLDQSGDPAYLIAEPIWTKRVEDGTQPSGWMFRQYERDARQRLADFIRSHSDTGP